MKKTFLLAAIPALFALSACDEAADTAAPEAAAPVADDDNDAPEPVAAPAAEEAPHDESVPHDH